MGIHLLHVEHVVLFVLFAVVVAVNSWFQRSSRGAHLFAGYTLCILIAAASVALRSDAFHHLSILISNFFFVLAYFFLFLSLEHVFGEPRETIHRLNLLLLAFSVLSPLYFGIIHPDTRIRLMVLSLAMGLQQGASAMLVFTAQDKVKRRAGIPIGSVLTVLALTNLVRFGGLIQFGAPTNYLQSGTFLQWFVISNTCLQSGIVIGYIWMTATLLQHDLAVQASTDPLTGVLNRRALQAEMDKALKVYQASGATLCVVTIDLDRFKDLNDTHGHLCGDYVLVEIANCLKQTLRSGDHLARIGGDEFAVLLTKTSIEEATEVAQRLRDAINQHCFRYQKRDLAITASFGLAQAQSPSTSWDSLLARCDQSLYAVKREGGNLVGALLF